jgi:hypothetical protein
MSSRRCAATTAGWRKPDGGSTSPTWSPIAIICWRRWPRRVSKRTCPASGAATSLLVESVEHRAALIAYLERQFPDEDFATIKAKADELELRLARATDPERSPVKAVTVQDEADSTHIRLTPAQGAALMMQPDVSTLRGRRDVAIIALDAGDRVARGEIVKLVVDDLYQTYGSVPAVRVTVGQRSQSADGALRRYALGAADRGDLVEWSGDGSSVHCHAARSRRYGRSAHNRQADDHTQCPTDVETISDFN